MSSNNFGLIRKFRQTIPKYSIKFFSDELAFRCHMLHVPAFLIDIKFYVTLTRSIKECCLSVLATGPNLNSNLKTS